MILVEVRGRWVGDDALARPSTGSVRFTPQASNALPADRVLLSERTISADLDATGAVRVRLQATDDPGLRSTGWSWRVEEIIDGVRRRWTLLVPASAAVPGLDLATVAPAVPGPVNVAYALSRDVTALASRVAVLEARPAGAVTSVAGRTGAVVLSPADAGARPAGTVPAAEVTGLALVATSGVYGDLTGRPAVDGQPTVASLRTLGRGATQAVAGTDPALTDARTPTLHAASHASGGADAVTPAAIGARAAGPVPAGDVTGLATVATSGVYGDLTGRPLADSAATVAGLRTLGTGAQQAAAGNDRRLGGLLNILAYGADPTGAADSAPAIRAAITASVMSGTNPATNGGIYMPPGIYRLGSYLDLTTVVPAGGLVSWTWYAEHGATMFGHGVNVAPPEGGQFLACHFRLPALDGTGVVGTTTDGYTLRSIVDSEVHIPKVNRGGDGKGFRYNVLFNQSPTPAAPVQGIFNNDVYLGYITGAFSYGVCFLGTTGVYGTQANKIFIRQVRGSGSHGIVVDLGGSGKGHNTSFNRFLIGVLENNTDYGFLDYSGYNRVEIENTNSNQTGVNTGYVLDPAAGGDPMVIGSFTDGINLNGHRAYVIDTWNRIGYDPPGRVLGVAQAGGGAAYATSSTGTVPLDAAVMAVPITVPASGRILVTMNAYVGPDTTGTQQYWQVLDGANAAISASREVNRGTQKTVSGSFLITGLSPRASLTVRWGWRMGGAAGTVQIARDGTLGVPIMTVEAA